MGTFSVIGINIKPAFGDDKDENKTTIIIIGWRLVSSDPNIGSSQCLPNLTT